MAAAKKEKVVSGYDRYINWKLFSIPLGLFLIMLLIPTPKSMLDVGVEYSLGDKYMRESLSQELFGRSTGELEQWQVQAVRMMEASVNQTAFGRGIFLKRDAGWCKSNSIPSAPAHLKKVMALAESIPADKFKAMLSSAYLLKTVKLTYDSLTPEEKARADKAGFQVKAAVGTVLFVVFCFVTEALPLPMVAFCVGIITLMIGVENRSTMPSLYWSDATWFIMGSLMFATAFVKTGVDRRISLVMFGRLKNPSLRWITFILILVIAPLTMFMSDHALAAIFLPIGVVLYKTATSGTGQKDPELAKMLMITIAMACNLGGSLAPSGAARNIIMMSYAEQMFDVSIGFGRWFLYCAPYLLIVIPLTWVVINWRFKPAITNLGPSIAVVKEEIRRSGGKVDPAAAPGGGHLPGHAVHLGHREQPPL